MALTAAQRTATMTVAPVLALIAVMAGAVAISGSGSAEADASTSRPGATIGAKAIRARPARPVPITIVHVPEAPGKALNITIDDGPDPVWTPRVLDVLKEYGVKATFCMVGPNARAHPGLVRRVVAEGHRLCDHSVTHDTGMDKKSPGYQKKEIIDALAMIEEASGGATVSYYRAPGGAFTPYSRKLAAANGMRPLGWNVDTKDFEKPGTDAIVSTVKSEITNGPTILFHDAGGDRSQTVAALRRILPWLKGQGYTFSFPKVH